jgi:DNA-binding protein H-NS
MPTKTYASLRDEIAALQAQADRLRNAEVAEIVAKIKEAISTYGLTHADLFGRMPAGKRATAQAAGAKYSDGKGGEWVGRGPRPQWLRDALAAGRSLDEFAVAGRKGVRASQANGDLSSDGKRGRKKAVKAKRKSAKYGDGAGNTWSGFGRKPKWMVEAIAAGRKQDDFLARS